MTSTLATAPVLALTVRPPWSHWLALGVKTIENRTWAPPGGWRAQLVIHAGKSLDRDDVNRGEHLAVATLVDVHRAGPDCRPTCTPWGQPGCFHWVLGDARRLVTIEDRGRQKLWIPPDDVIQQVLAVA